MSSKVKRRHPAVFLPKPGMSYGGSPSQTLAGEDALTGQRHGQLLTGWVKTGSLVKELREGPVKKPYEEPIRGDEQNVVGPDRFFESDLVTELRRQTFKEFLENKDVVLVMFYKPCDFQSVWSKDLYVQAAETTTRKNHAYASVNCAEQETLCFMEKVPQFPFWRMYTRGQQVGEFKEPTKCLFDEMKKWVQTVPSDVSVARRRPPKR